MLRRIRTPCCPRPTQPLLHQHPNSPRPPWPRHQSSASDPSSPPPSTPPLPRVPPNPTALHHDLDTFLAHAARTKLSPTSTTYVGTHYEYTVQATLRRFALALSRTGGRGDAGIDLLGTWHLPATLAPLPLRVLVQCKAFKAKLGPNLVRELEGAFVGAPSGWRGKGIVGILVSPREATKGVRDAMGRSRWPICWVMLEGGLKDEGQGKVRQILWNKAACDIGLEGLAVTVKYGSSSGGDEEVKKECVLVWHGHVVPGLEEQRLQQQQTTS